MSIQPNSPALHAAERNRRMAVLTRFIQGMSHDYANLITAITNNVDLLARGGAADSPAGKALRNLDEAAQLAAALTRRIQAYVACPTAALETISLSVLIQRLLPALAATVPAPATLQAALEPELPMIPLAAGLVEESLRNLLTNAVEAMAGHAGDITVGTAFAHGSRIDPHTCLLIEHLRPAPYAALDVSNDGPPLSPEVRDHMFDPYFSTRIRAPGLGLCTVLGMARTHRAVIAVPVQPTGCTIRILFPL